MRYTRLSLRRFVGMFAVILAQDVFATPADSLRLLWRNESISGVTAHAFSHSGKILALVNSNEIMLWDWKKGKCVRTIEIPYQGYTLNTNYIQMAFSPNDSEIILLNNPRPPPIDCPSGERIAPGFELHVGVSTGKVLQVKGVFTSRSDWALSSDARYIVVLSDSGNLSVHSSRDFSTLSTLDLPRISPALRASRYRGWRPPQGVWFVPGLNKVIVFWNGKVMLVNIPALQEPKVLADSVRSSPTVSEESVFIPGQPRVLDSKTLLKATLQPPTVIIPADDYKGYSGKSEGPPLSALLFGNGKFLVSRYQLWRGMLFDYGTPPGEDTLIFTSKDQSFRPWGIRLNRFMLDLGEVPGKEMKLLFGDGSTFMIVNAETRSIRYLASGTRNARFDKNGKELLEQSGHDLYTFDGYKWSYRGKTDDEPPDRASNAPFLKWYLRVIPAGHDKVLAYMDYWSKNDMAKIFDLKTGDSSMVFPGGLNYGMGAGAVSSDNNWVATVSAQGDGRLWRASDGALKLCFSAREACDAAFLKNDRFLLYANTYGRDSAISLLDLQTGKQTRVAKGNSIISMFLLNSDCSRLAVFRYHRNQWNGAGPAITEMYETPASWRTGNPSFNPKTVYLPLRFYLPNDAPEALDTNGKPFSPPRTHVELELRYGNGKLLKKILDGAFHKGKWHEWVYDMTPYPKGTYIMHTEIGGVVKDEKMEVR